MYVIIASCALAVTNLIAFALMAIDKKRARAGAWRISEKALMLSGACFGALGGLIGMNVFRHKTQHRLFTIGMPLMLLAQAVLVVAGYFAFR